MQAESRDDGRQRVDRLPRAVRLGREHARHVRERRLRGRPRDRARRAARAGVPRAARRARGDRDARHHDDRGARRAARRSTPPRPRRRCRSSKDDGTLVLALAPRRRPARGGEAASGARRRLPAGDRRRDPRGVRRRRRARSARSGSPARSSPTRRCARASSSPARTAPAGTCAASRRGRDFQPRFADIRQPVRATRCPECGGALGFQTAIEVGHIFKLGTRYSEPLGATFLDEDGAEKPIVMGCYGIGPGRVMAAAVEQHHDEHGIVWPAAIAPYDVHVRRARLGRPEVVEIGRGGRRQRSSAAGLDVLLDDREPAPGREVRRRRPDRLPDPGHGRQEDARGRRGRRARPDDAATRIACRAFESLQNG